MKHIPVVMPQMGQSVAEGTILRWHKKVGDPIKADEVIVEIESDKITIEVESPADGWLASALRAEGEKAAVGETIGAIAPEIEVEEPAPIAAEPKPHAGSDADQVLVSAASPPGAFVDAALPELTRDWFSPYVLRQAIQNGISLEDLQAIRGTGARGRVTKSDLLLYLARRLAEPAPAPGGSPAEALPGNMADLGEVRPMTSIRKTIADHMVQSIRTSAHVTMVHAVDVTHIVDLRERIKDEFQRRYGVKMTYTAVMMFATSHVLRDFPVINASVFGGNLVLRKDINIGCAVALPDESLVVPVLRDADKMTFPQLAQELERLIQVARQKSLTRQDIDGGTFTISNFGAFGSIIGTPIINQPQVAILGMGAVFKTPVVVDNQICIRDRIYLSFSFDHRVIDGAIGGRFLNAIQKATEALTREDLDVAALL